MSGEPLIGAVVWRASVGCLVLCAAALSTLAAFLSALEPAEAKTAYFAALAALAVPVATVVVSGRWASGPFPAWVQRISLSLFVAGCAVVVVVVVVSATEVQAHRDVSGLGDGVLAFHLLLVAGALASAAALLSAVPLSLGRRPVAAAALALVAGGALASGTGVAVATGERGCSTLTLDAAAWDASHDGLLYAGREEIAEALVRCGRLRGRTRAEVGALLGRPLRGGRTWTYEVGDGFWGPTTLEVTFDRRGRVSRARVDEATFD